MSKEGDEGGGGQGCFIPEEFFNKSVFTLSM